MNEKEPAYLAGYKDGKAVGQLKGTCTIHHALLYMPALCEYDEYWHKNINYCVHCGKRVLK